MSVGAVNMETDRSKTTIQLLHDWKFHLMTETGTLTVDPGGDGGSQIHILRALVECVHVTEDHILIRFAHRDLCIKPFKLKFDTDVGLKIQKWLLHKLPQ